MILEVIDKHYILKRVSPEDIFTYYLGRRVQTKRNFTSSLRIDTYPTCSFKYCKDGVLRFIDWAKMEKPEDCFGLVERIYRVDYNKALRIIIKDMKLEEKDIKFNPDDFVKEGLKKFDGNDTNFNTKSRITVLKESRRFTIYDAKYLKSLGLNSDIAIKFGVYSVDTAWINDTLIYRRDNKDPCIGYYFGNNKYGHEKWKLYFYKRTKDHKYSKFMGNTNRINGWIQLPEKGDLLIITKSLKDVMVLYKFGISAIAMQSENTFPYERIVNELKERFTTIYTLLDFDFTGIKMASKIKKVYGIKPLFLSNGRFGSLDYGAKDISDYIEKYGETETIKLLFFGERLANDVFNNI